MFARYNITDESDQRQALLNGQTYNVAAASPLSTKRETLPSTTTETVQERTRIGSLKLAPFFFA